MTTPFTQEELNVLASGLDALVRNEGNAIGQAGIQGLAGVDAQVANRLTMASSIFAKINQMSKDLAAAEAQAIADKATEDAKKAKAKTADAGG
jgi:hypothetical protein